MEPTTGTSQRLLVIGAHGKVALLAQPLLVADGHQVSGVVRNPDHVTDVEATGATAVVGDLETMDSAAIENLVQGHDVVVWSAGAGGGDPTRTMAVDRDAAIRTIDACAEAGVPRFVMVSYFGAGPDHGVDPENSFFHYAEAKAAADEHLRASTLAWTILKPSALTLDGPTGLIAANDEVAGSVSRGNVARVIASVVRHPDDVRARDISFNDGDQPIDEVITD